MATRQEIKADLIAWSNGDLTKMAPSCFGGAGSEANELLLDAILFEEGRYECSDAAQRENAIASIERFCESDAVEEFVDA